MATQQEVFRFRSRRRRNGLKDERETELTLHYPAIVLVGLAILGALVAIGVIPAEVFGKVLAKVLAM